MNDEGLTLDLVILNNNNEFLRGWCQCCFFSLSKLSKSKATGLDNISAKVTRDCADLNTVSFCDLFFKTL